MNFFQKKVFWKEEEVYEKAEDGRWKEKKDKAKDLAYLAFH